MAEQVPHAIEPGDSRELRRRASDITPPTQEPMEHLLDGLSHRFTLLISMIFMVKVQLIVLLLVIWLNHLQARGIIKNDDPIIVLTGGMVLLSVTTLATFIAIFYRATRQ